MIRLITILFIATTFLTPTWAGNDFEGEFHMTNERVTKDGKKAIEKVTFMVKGNKLALSTGKENEKIILDVVTGDILTVQQQGSQYTAMKLNVDIINQIGGIASFTGSNYGYANDESDATFKATGQSKDIDGYTCKHYLVADGNDKGEVWLADDFPYDFTALVKLFNLEKSWADNPTKNVMPLAGKTTNSATGEISYFQISVEKKDVSDDLFEVPANAQVIDMTMMLENMLKNSDPEAVKKMMKQMIPQD